VKYEKTGGLLLLFLLDLNAETLGFQLQLMCWHIQAILLEKWPCFIVILCYCVIALLCYSVREW